MCKGSWGLGTACGKCQRRRDGAIAEIARLRQEVSNAKADADMYAKAWQRELGPYGFRNKRHHIDAMVLTTRDLVADAVSARRVLDAVERWKKDAVVALTLGVPEPRLADYLTPLSAPDEGERSEVRVNPKATT